MGTLLLLGPVAVAACGSAPPPGGSAGHSGITRSSSPAPAARPSTAAIPAGRVLCADPDAVTKVIIASNSLAQQIRPLRPLPARFVTEASGDPARSLARALCALPRMPRGLVNCPMELPGQFMLRFWAALRQRPGVRVTPTGCGTVTGLRPVRRVLLASPFWQALVRAADHVQPVGSRHPGIVVDPAGYSRRSGPPSGKPASLAFPGREDRDDLGAVRLRLRYLRAAAGA